MRITVKYLFIITLLTILYTSCILLSDRIQDNAVSGISLLLFAIDYISVICIDIALRFWAYKNIVWHSSTSANLTMMEYAVLAAFILIIVNSTDLLLTGMILHRQDSVTAMIRINLIAGFIIFLYYSAVKGRLITAVFANRTRRNDICELDKEMSQQCRSYIYLKTSDGVVKRIFLDDILFISSMEKNTIISYTAAKDVVAIRLKKILSILPDSMFVQTHKSYIVNKNKISAISSDKMIVSGAVIPIGDNFRNALCSS